LSTPESVDDLNQLDPKKYGVIVSSGFKRGLLLPDLEGVDTVQEQIEIAKSKAGIYPGEEVKLFRFEVKRYH
jgi:AMMECR1 domain-containing protein